MNKIAFSCLALSALVSIPAQPKATRVAALLYNTGNTPIGTLLDDPRLRDHHGLPHPQYLHRPPDLFCLSVILKSLQRLAGGPAQRRTADDRRRGSPPGATLIPA